MNEMVQYYKLFINMKYFSCCNNKSPSSERRLYLVYETFDVLVLYIYIYLFIYLFHGIDFSMRMGFYHIWESSCLWITCTFIQLFSYFAVTKCL